MSSIRFLTAGVFALLSGAAIFACDFIGPDCENDSRNRVYFSEAELIVPLDGENLLIARYGFSNTNFDSCINNVSSEATWVSTDSEIFEIGPVLTHEGESGRVIRGLRLGTAQVKATYRGKTGTALVTVIDNELPSAGMDLR